MFQIFVNSDIKYEGSTDKVSGKNGSIGVGIKGSIGVGIKGSIYVGSGMKGTLGAGGGCANSTITGGVVTGRGWDS